MFITSLLSFLVIFSIVVFIHELWHYCVAIMNWVKVEEFAIWMPPLAKLIKKTKSWTSFVLNYIPFGWYVKMYWEIDDGSKKKKKWAFFALPIYKRAQIVIAWVLMNFVFAWGILAILFTLWAKPLLLTKDDFDKYKNLWVILVEDFEWIKILDFIKDSSWEASGLVKWDIVLSINWVPVSEENFSKMNNEWWELHYEISRSSTIINMQVSPDAEWKIWAFVTWEGSVKEISDISFPFIESIAFTFKECMRIAVLTIKTFWEVIAWIFTWITPDWVSGPIWIAKMSWMVVSNWSFEEIFKFMALISLSLAVINILPIPVLDWWHLLFLWIECIIGRRAISKFRWSFNLLGFVFLIWIMVFITYWDIYNLFT